MDDKEYEIDISGQNRHVWLCKIPSFLAEAWKKAPNNAVLGKVTITQTGNNKTPTVTMQLSNEVAANANIPAPYNLNFSTPPPLYILSKSEGKMAIEGIVDNFCNAKPAKITEQYSQILKKRFEKTQIKRKIQRKDDSISTIIKPRAAPYVKTQKREPRQKAERMPKPQLMDLVFSLFQQQPNWTLKELIERTKQPVNYLKKEILDEICVYNKRGKNKATYELKPEYKETTETVEVTGEENEEEEWE